MKVNSISPHKRWIGAALVATVAASACCVGPLVLVALGLTGAWAVTLTALEPVRPIFIAFAVGLFGMAYRRLYRRAAVCAPAAVCTLPGARRRQRVVFWFAVAAAALLISFPWYAVLFY